MGKTALRRLMMGGAVILSLGVSSAIAEQASPSGVTLGNNVLPKVLTKVSQAGEAIDPNDFKDNLGNHTATQNLNMAGWDILGADEVAADDLSAAKANISALTAGSLTSPSISAANGRIIRLADPSADTDAVNYGTLKDLVSKAGDDLGDHVATKALLLNGKYLHSGLITGYDGSGNPILGPGLSIGAQKISGLAGPAADGDAANKKYVDDKAAGAKDNLGNHTATANLDMSAKKIVDLGAPSNPGDAATKAYVDGKIVAPKAYTGGDGIDIDAALSVDVDGTVVRTSGAQTLADKKTFTSELDASGLQIRLRKKDDTTGAGFLIRNDGSDTYFLVTNAGSAATGSYNSLRPFTIDNANGNVTMAHAVTMNGAGAVKGNLTVGQVVDDVYSGILTVQSSGNIKGNLTVGKVVNGVASGNLVVNDNATVNGSAAIKEGLTVGKNVSGTTSGTLTTLHHAVIGGSLAVNGTTKASGYFYAGTTAPGNTERLNYDGIFYATNIYSKAYYYFSDRNLKKDIVTLESLDGLEKILKLRPVSYAWKADGKQALGVIAQEVEGVLPTAVITGDDGIKAVDYQQIISPMIASIQELSALVTKLDGRIAELEAAAK